MASARGHKRSGGGFFSNLFRGLFSGETSGRAESGRKKRGVKPRLLRFEGCEQRQLLAVTVGWEAATGVLTLAGDAADDAVAVIGQSSYVDIYVGGHFQVRLTNANANNVNTINFTGAAGNDSLSVKNIQPSGSLAIGDVPVRFSGVESLSLSKCGNVTVNTNGGLRLGASSVTGTLDVNAAGALTQSGALVVGGTTTLDVGVANNITLTQAKNNFSKIVVTAGNDVAIVDVNSLILGDAGTGLTVSGNLSVQASISSSSRGSLTQQGTVILDGTDASTRLAVGRASTITLDDPDNVFSTGAGTVAITSAGTATLANDGDITLEASNVKGNLTISLTTGSVNPTPLLGGPLVVAKTATFNVSDTGSVTLDNPANNFNIVAVTTSGAPVTTEVTIVDANAVALGPIGTAANPVATLAVTAHGAITQKAALHVLGATTLDAGAAGNITLSNAGNNLGANAGDTVSITGRNVTVRNSDAMDLGDCTVAGNFSVNAGGPITDDPASVLTVAGKMTLAAGAANNVTLDSDNLLREVAVTSGNDVTITDTEGGLALGKSRISGFLTVNADGPLATGALTQTGALVVSGATTLNVGPDDAITLTTTSNNFSSVAVTSGSDVSLADANSLVLGTSTVSGNLSVVTRGGLTQSGAVSVLGNTTLTAGRSSTIDLATLANDFGGPVSITCAGNANLFNISPAQTTFDTTSVTGNLTVTSAGAIDQVVGGGAMVVGRTAWFVTTGDITLDNPANNFFVARLYGNGVTLTDVNSVALGESTIDSTLTVTAGKAISQTGALEVAGDATFIAGPTAKDSIVLNNSSNDFQAAVSVTAGGNVALTDSDAIDLGESTVEGDLTVTADGDITDSGNLTVAGKTILAADAADITLDNDNDFVGAVAVTSAASATLNDTGELVLGQCSIGDDLTVTAAGALTQSDWVEVGDIATLTATGFDITMDLDGNDFTTLLVDGDNVSVVDNSALILGASTITGDLDVTTSGDITDDGAVIVSGDTTLDAGSGNNIELDDAHDFYQVAVESGYDVTLNDTGALILGASDVTGALTVTAGGAVSQDGALAVTLTMNVTAADSITLDDPDNSFNTVAASGTAITLYNNADIVLGDTGGGVTTTTGDLIVDVVGQISDGAAVTVAGNASFTARTAAGYNDIVLANLDSIAGALSLAGNNVSVDGLAFGDLTIGNATASGDLAIILSEWGQAMTNSPGSNMSVEGKTTLMSTGAFGSIDLYTAGCVFGEWAYGDPTDFTSDLYLEADSVTVHP